MKRVLALVLALVVSSCAFPPWKSTGPSPADTITYEVSRPAGDTSTGAVTIIMASPSGTTTATSALATPFLSGPVAGYSQFTNNTPAVTVIGYGCFNAFVLKNADIVAQASGCGQPGTFTAK